MNKLFLALLTVLSLNVLAATSSDSDVAVSDDPNLEIKYDGAGDNAPTSQGCCNDIKRSSKVGYLTSARDIARTASSSPVLPVPPNALPANDPINLGPVKTGN